MPGTNTSTTDSAVETVKQQTQKAAETVKTQSAKNAQAAKQVTSDAAVAGASFMKLPEETVRFVSHRFDRQMTHVKTLMGCRSPSEFFDAQSRFATEAIEEYLEEAERVVDLASEIGTDYLSAWGDTVNKA